MTDEKKTPLRAVETDPAPADPGEAMPPTGDAVLAAVIAVVQTVSQNKVTNDNVVRTIEEIIAILRQNQQVVDQLRGTIRAAVRSLATGV